MTIEIDSSNFIGGLWEFIPFIDKAVETIFDRNCLCGDALQDGKTRRLAVVPRNHTWNETATMSTIGVNIFDISDSVEVSRENFIAIGSLFPPPSANLLKRLGAEPIDESLKWAGLN